MSDEARLETDYEQTTRYFHHLVDIRFKLLAFVPFVTGAAVGLLTEGDSAASTRLIVGLLGFLVTVGIVIYDLRNTQIHDRLVSRAKFLEEELGLPRNPRRSRNPDKPADAGGAFIDRPGQRRKLFGLIEIWHDRGLALVYSSVLAAWTYLILDALFALRGVEGSTFRSLALVAVPLAVFVAFFRQIQR
jgi:hypothetical protein